MVDLHSHTVESDGSYTPEELVATAVSEGLTTLAITDHDTFSGYEIAAQAGSGGLRLIRGIELNTRQGGRSVHLLAYFVDREPTAKFRRWLDDMVQARRRRNEALAAKLRDLGVDIQLAEVEKLGRTLTGRPHFARVLVEKGYAADRDEAFDKFIGETGRAFVERDAPTLAETLPVVAEAGGIASLAHPIRLGYRDVGREERMLGGLRGLGLPAIEVYHSDHTVPQIERYQALANKYGFRATGGSDFHGSYKPGIRLGYAANGTVVIPDSVTAAFQAR